MVRLGITMLRIVQGWFAAQYGFALLLSIITRHHWRFVAANIAALSTIIGLAATGQNFHASLGRSVVDLSFLGVELPYNLEKFPITVAMAFAAIIFLSDSVGYEIYGKKLVKKAVISTLFSSMPLVLNMASFLMFGYVVIAIPYFKTLFRTFFVAGLLTQFCFTMSSSVLDVIFHRIGRFRPLYVILFLISPVLSAVSLFEFYMSDSLATFVENFDETIAPFTKENVHTLFLVVVGMLFIWLGKAARESRYSDNVVLYFLSYVLTVLTPASSMFVTVKLRRFYCHRDLAAIYNKPSGLLGTVLIACVAALLAAIPLVAGSPANPPQDDDDDEEVEETKETETVDAPKEEIKEEVKPSTKSNAAAKGKAKGKSKQKVE